MGIAEILALIAKAADLAMTLRAENRAATQAEVDALYAAADAKDDAAVAADDAAQKAAAQQP
jgi:hypothetical protein